MIHKKTKEEIAIMQFGGKMLADVLFAVLDQAKPGITELELDALAQKLIREKGGEPGFMRVDGYKHTTCISTNDVVVHGIPTAYALQAGDVFGVDCGVYYKSFHTDMSETIIIDGKSTPEKDRFLEVGKEALEKAIAKAVPGNHVGDISRTIQSIVEKEGGYSIVRSLVGHGVGHELHESPEVPGFLVGSVAKTPLLVEGMVIAIEVIYNMGKRDVMYGSDGWTIKTADGSLAGLFERTVAITAGGPVVLTK